MPDLPPIGSRVRTKDGQLWEVEIGPDPGGMVMLTQWGEGVWHQSRWVTADEIAEVLEAGDA